MFKPKHRPIFRSPLPGALLFALAVGITGMACAEEAPVAKADTEQAPKPAAKQEGESTPSAEVFIPTEEISEDFAVAFPVDI